MGTVLIWLFLAGAVLCWQCMGLVASSFVINKWLRAGFRGVILLHGVAAMGFAFWVAIAVWQNGWVHATALTGPVLMVLLYLTLSAVVLWQLWWRTRDTDGKLAPARRKLILALGVLGLMCVGLHVVTVGIMRSVAEATAAAEVARLREKIAPTFDPPGPKPVSLDGSPVDGEAAYQALEKKQKQNGNRWDVLEDRVGTLSRYLLSEGEPFDTYRTKPTYVRTNTPEDDIEETLDETMTRFKVEIDELREVTRVTPYIRHFTLDELDSGVHGRNTVGLVIKCDVLQMDAISAARQGDIKRAVEDLNAMERLAGHAIEIRSSIGVRLGVAIRYRNFFAAETVLNAPNLHVEDLADWQIEQGVRCQQWALAALDREEYLCLQMVKDATTGPLEDYYNFRSLIPPFWYTESLLSACAGPGWVEDVKRECEVFRILEANSLYLDLAASEPKYDREDRSFGRWIAGSYRMIFGQAAQVDAHTFVLHVACVAMRYREKHGKYPDSLSALVGEGLTAVPMDPMDGRPLRMKVVEGGLIIYSIGMDGIDNGGEQPPMAYIWEGDDIAFYLGEAYHRRRAEFEKVCAERRAAEGK